MTDPADGLTSFRLQWQQELENNLSGARVRRESSADVEELEQRLDNVEISSELDQARIFFHKAVLLERQGKVFDAIPLYKKAVNLVPDIEYQMHEAAKQVDAEKKNNNQVQIEVIPTNPSTTTTTAHDIDELDDNVDLCARFLDSFQESGGRWCERAADSNSTSLHISDLPVEVFLIISRWIVSNELDIQALEKSALVCKGFYLYARDPKLWRMICLKVWGLQLGTLNGSAFNSWRQMYFQRSRLRFNGCYISKTEYFRLGENSFQDSAYKPVHHVEYYRYLRFFPDGIVLMFTTADEPLIGVRRLKSRDPKRKEVLRGFYRLHNDMVTIMLQKTVMGEAPTIIAEQVKRKKNEKRVPPKAPVAYEQVFQIQLEIRDSSKRRFSLLHWKQYKIIKRRNDVELSSSEFPLSKDQYPMFHFTRVDQYLEESNSILAT